MNVGSTRSSKSYTAVQIAVLKAITEPNIRIIIVGVTLSIVRSTILSYLKEIIGDDWSRFGRFYKSEFAYYFNNNSEIIMMSAENPEKLRGVKSNYVFLEEINIAKNGEELVTQLSMRCSGFIMFTMNPSRRLKYLDAIQSRPDCKYLHSTYKDNRFLEKRIVDDIEYKAKHDDRFKQIYVKGKYMANADNAVFTNWSLTDNIPIAEECKKNIYALDWGYKPDPTVLTHYKRQGRRIYLKEIFRGTEAKTKDIADVLEKLPSSSVIVADNSEKRLVAEVNQELKNRGKNIYVYTIRKPKHQKKTDAKLLQEYDIYLYSRDTEMISEFEELSYKKVSGVLTTDLQDGNDHSCDNLFYAFRFDMKGSVMITI
jgi:phage terminase large subunit